jgi:hypothetical protein
MMCGLCALYMTASIATAAFVLSRVHDIDDGKVLHLEYLPLLVGAGGLFAAAVLAFLWDSK